MKRGLRVLGGDVFNNVVRKIRGVTPSAFFLTLVDDADAATARATLGISGGSTLADFKDSVRAATTGAGTLATSFENGDTIDGVTLATGDRILIKDQATVADNGIYVVAASGAPARATDFDADAEVTGGCIIPVAEGTANGDKLFMLTTNDPITLGSTGLVFSAMGAGGSGTVNTGAANALAYYPGSGTTVDDVPGSAVDARGGVALAPTAASSGSPNLFTVTGPAHTGLAASTEASDINLALARTVQFATGSLTLQRVMVIAGVTYAFVGASTLSDAVTLDVAPPVAGTNATITRSTAIRANVTNTAHHGIGAAMPSGANGDAFFNSVAGTKVFRVAQQSGETNVVVRANGDVSTSATDGFLYPSQFSAFTKPTGTPTTYAGAPIVVGKDATFGWHGLWTYVNGGWIDNSGIFTRHTSSSGTGAQTIDWAVWGAHISRTFTVGAGNVTFTFTAPAVVGSLLTLKFIQDSTGSRTVTWPASVKWEAGTVVQPNTAANSVTIYLMAWDGTNYNVHSVRLDVK